MVIINLNLYDMKLKPDFDSLEYNFVENLQKVNHCFSMKVMIFHLIQPFDKFMVYKLQHLH